MKAVDAPPTCGVMSTPGADHSGWSAGSGSGSVTSRAARIRPAERVPHQRVGVDDTAAGDVDQQRAVGHRSEERVVDQPGRVLAQRHDDDDDVVVRQQLRQLVHAVHRPHQLVSRAARGWRPRSPAPRTA